MYPDYAQRQAGAGGANMGNPSRSEALCRGSNPLVLGVTNRIMYFGVVFL